MSANLDKSLDDIVVGRRQDARRRGSRRNKASAAPGGVKKNKATKASAKGAKSTPAAAPPKDSKIMVSGMPADVNEANIKEYFTKSAGPVKKVMLTYNQNGTSQGIASIVFSKPDTAAKAARELNGLLVDGRPMKIEVIVDAARAPGIPEPKPVTERVAGQPKAQPKPATEAKAGRRNRRAARRGKASGRPKRKTAEELDAEMEDYFVTNENGAPAEGNAPVNGQAQQQPATNGGGEDLGMGDIS